MKSAVRLAVAAAVSAAAGGAAWSPPAMPPQLENLVAESKVIVVGNPRTYPEHPGDVYELDVDEVLKGTAPAPPLKVTAAYYFTGCIVRENEPPPPALEPGAKKVMLFIRD